MSADKLVNLYKERQEINSKIAEMRKATATVVNATSGVLAAYPPPTVIEAPENTLDPRLGATVKVEYPFEDYDLVTVYWTGEDGIEWESDSLEYLNGELPTFPVPLAIVLACANSVVEVSYIVIRLGKPTPSRTLALEVSELGGSSNFTEIDFEDLPLGYITSPIKRKGLTLESKVISVVLDTYTNSKILGLWSPATITFDNDITLCLLTYYQLTSPESLIAVSRENKIIDQVERQGEFRGAQAHDFRSYMGTLDQQKFNTLKYNSGRESTISLRKIAFK